MYFYNLSICKDRLNAKQKRKSINAKKKPKAARVSCSQSHSNSNSHSKIFVGEGGANRLCRCLPACLGYPCPGRATWHSKHLPIDRILTEAISLFGRRVAPPRASRHAACAMTDMQSTLASASASASCTATHAHMRSQRLRPSG